MSGEDEKARAARKSREWKARQAEIAAAIAVTEDNARESRSAVERERIERLRESRPSHVIFEFAVIAVFLFVALLLAERYLIEGNVESCFASPARALHQGNCANTIAGSRWWWLLPAEQKELIRAKQVGDR